MFYFFSSLFQLHSAGIFQNVVICVAVNTFQCVSVFSEEPKVWLYYTKYRVGHSENDCL